jgi:hypothetical protein
MGEKTNPIYASEAFLPMSFPQEDFRKDYVPFVRPTDVVSPRRSIPPDADFAELYSSQRP